MSTPLSFTRCLLLAGMLVAICAAAFWVMDVYTDPMRAPASAAPEGGGEAPAHPGSGRVFAFLIDSLRYETAIDPATMPATSALRSRSAWGRMLSTRDAVTVPALRAAFTGRVRFTVFGFVRNLWHGDEGLSSMFSQLAAAGRRAAIYSDGSFRQFGGGPMVERFPIDPVGRRSLEAETQSREVLAALEAWRSGRYDLVIAHVTFADHEAHRTGIHHADYAATFGRADDLVRLLDAAISPEDTFVVFGDHGHDELGRHMMGLDVPTIAVFRGPGFRAGFDMETFPITGLRSLFSFALKLPLPEDGVGGRHPGALIASAPLPEAFASGVDLMNDVESATGGVQHRYLAAYLATVLALALLAGAWVAAVGAALRWAACTAGAAILLVGWGWALAVIWPHFHYPRFPVWVPVVIAAVAAGVPVAQRFGAVRSAWALFLVWGVLSYPSIYRYGAPLSMGPVWMALLAYVLLERARARRRDAQPMLQRGDWTAAAALLFLLPFAFARSDWGQFTCWTGPLAHAIFRGDGLGGSLALALAGAGAAKLVLFVERGTRPMTPVIGAAVAGALWTVEVLWLDRPGAGMRYLWVGAIAASAGAWLALWKCRDLPDRAILLRIAALATLTLAFFYSVRVQGQMYLWLDWLLAAMVLSGRSLKDAGTAAYLLLLACGVWAAGWAGLAWTFHRLEWGFLYDWLDTGFVEDNSGLFLPGIVVRFVIPMIMMRIALAAGTGAARPYPQRAAALLAGLKTLSVLFITLGIGLHVFGDDVYLDGVQQTGIWCLLSAALIFSPRRHEAPGHAG